MKGQEFHINTERATITVFVDGQTGGQIKALLFSIHLKYVL